MTKKDWLLGFGALAGFTVLFFIGLHLWVLFAPADAVQGFAVHGGEVVALEAHYGGEEGISGGRLVRIDARTGAVTHRQRLDWRSFVGQVDDELWLRTEDGLEVRSLPSLELVADGFVLAQRQPELAVLGDPERSACVDLPRRQVRFVAKDGRNVAFDLKTRALTPSDDTGCSSSSAGFAGGTLRDGRRLQTGSMPASQRKELTLDGAPLGLDGLELQVFVSDQRTQQLLELDGDALLSRRTATTDDGEAELLRLSLTEKKARWSTPLGVQRLSAEQVARVGDVLVVGDGHRLFALDWATGRLLWKRVP